MTDALFLAPVAGAAPGAEILVTGPEGRHAVAVRRMRAGERVLLADGEGAGVAGVVTAAEKEGLRVRVEEVLAESEPALRLVAAQALAKGDRAELAVEAMTEVGVSEIVPWQAERSIVRWSGGDRGDKQRGRWESSIREAAKQARRLRIPRLARTATTAELCRRVATCAAAYVLHEDASGWLADEAVPETGEVLIVIGPEGGISPAELDQLTAAGARAVRIAAHVLRTSTAGVVALAQLQAMGKPS